MIIILINIASILKTLTYAHCQLCNRILLTRVKSEKKNIHLGRFMVGGWTVGSPLGTGLITLLHIRNIAVPYPGDISRSGSTSHMMELVKKTFNSVHGCLALS